MKRIVIFLLSAILLISCSNIPYTCAIPNNSTAIVAMNGMRIVNEDSPFKAFLTPFLNNDSKELKGIDLSKDIYFFEAADGSIGFCAAVSDFSDLDDFCQRMNNVGGIKYLTERDGISYYRIMDQWIMGFDSDGLLAMGPVVGAEAEGQMIKRMAHLFDQEEENSILQSQIWKHIEHIDEPIKMVAQADALPQQLTSFYTIGAPKGTDPADILIEAGLSFSDSIMTINGSCCSYNDHVKQEMQKEQAQFRPITANWQKHISPNSAINIFMNTNGEEFIPHLQSNKALSTLLMGSTALDKIRANDGNISVALSSRDSDGVISDNMSAEVTSLTPEQKSCDENLIVIVNIKAFSGAIANALTPITGKFSRIIYKQKTFKTK